MIADNRERVVAVSNDPNTIMSYGILIDQMMMYTSQKYQWNLISEEYEYGRPVMHGYYIKWRSGKTEVERDTEAIPNAVRNLRPIFVFSIGDLQHFRMTRAFIRRNVPWIHWIPIDNHDRNSLFRTSRTIMSMDIPVAMSKFGMDFCNQNRLKVDDFVYPFIKTKPTKADKQKLMSGDKFTFEGYRPLTKEDEVLKEVDKFKKSIQIEDKDVLLFVGRPGWRKNLQFLFSAFRKLIKERERKNLFLYLHTDILDPAATVDIPKEIHAHEIPDEYVGRTLDFSFDTGIPCKVLNALYNLSTIQISTHGGEGFGIPLAEGMATELPFVATNCTTTPELAQNSEGVWERGFGAKVSKNMPDKGVERPYVDLEDFCDKVEILLDSPDKCEKMGKAGRKWIIENCSVPVITKKWLEIFGRAEINKAKISVKKPLIK